MSDTMTVTLKAPYRFIKVLQSNEEARTVRLLAENRRSGGFVSIKAISLKHDAQLELRCVQDAAVLQRIYSPHLAATYEYWSQDDAFWLAQEYVHGKDLEEYLAGIRPKDRVLRSVRIFKDIAHAVDVLHMAGLVLGRITPGDIIVDPMGMPKLLYHSLAPGEKSSTRMLRRVAYQATMASVAPESFNGGQAGIQADVYAFGALMYNAVCGSQHVIASRYDDAIQAIRERTPDAPSTLEPGVPAALDAIILDALARDAGRRTHSMRELAKQLAELLDSQPKGSAAGSPRN